MPAMTEKALLKLIKAQGFTVNRTGKGHYLVVNSQGVKVAGYAVGHGSNKGMVNAPYVKEVLVAIGLK